MKRTEIVPCLEKEIDYTRVAPIVDHPLFARLAGVRQLGTASKVFVGATHTRREHMLAVYQRTKDIAKRFINDGIIDRWEEGALVVYGLLHDVGHGPFSHNIEAITTRNHKQNGELVIREMRPAIESVSVDPERIIRMLQRRDRLSDIVSDGNLGTDKIDYLERDAHHIGIRGAPETKRIVRFLVWNRARGLGVETTVIEAVKKFLGDYAFMYKEVYMKKSALLVDRHMQKMISVLCLHGLTEDELWRMTDAEVEGRLALEDDEEIRWLYGRYRELRFPRTLLVFRPHDTVEFEPGDLPCFGVPMKTFDATRKVMNQTWLTELERAIARIAELEPYQVCVVAPLEEKRFRPQDVTVWEPRGPFSLREKYPELYTYIESSFAHYAALRVAVFPEHVEQASRRMESITEHVREVIESSATV